MFKEKTYVLTEGDGEGTCPCNICAFNEMGAEGAVACKEAPPCEEGHYVEKREEIIDWDEEMKEFREEMQK